MSVDSQKHTDLNRVLIWGGGVYLMSVELISNEICQECEYMNIHTNTPPPPPY